MARLATDLDPLGLGSHAHLDDRDADDAKHEVDALLLHPGAGQEAEDRDGAADPRGQPASDALKRRVGARTLRDLARMA